ncbi:hypothetical protein ABZZ79_27885 [Streptomyces sp. NPDC006458]|uniref:hypothetical protein n=1 Tax=Streptomyces sp. NPDC006458 TaxID=3154302 RepID=UPI0033BDBDB8
MPDSPTIPTKVAQALAAIEAAKQDSEPCVATCLDTIADLIKRSGDPDAVFDRLMVGFAREELRALASAHGIRLAESTVEAVASGHLTETLVIWEWNERALAVIPRGQRPADTLAQLRAAIAERDEEARLSSAFQASVAAGYVEDVETWHARTGKAAG